MTDKVFRAKAPVFMKRLLADIPGFGLDDAGAVFGNGGHESGGLTNLQEDRPVVKGSRGGFGWFQWTGQRRRAFEAWCKARKLDPAGDEANYGFLVHELRGTEKHAVAAVLAAEGLPAKVKAFEKAYERAGVKHYPSREKWARIAVEAYAAKYGQPTEPGRPKLYTDRTTVEIVQRRLYELGYTEVGSKRPDGSFDGVPGSLTRAAILAFRDDNGLPRDPVIDDAMLAALDTADPRKLSPKRGEATEQDVREKVPEVHSNFLTRIVAFFGGILSLLAAMFDGILGNIGVASGYIQPVKDAVGDMPGWVWFGLIAIIAGGLYLVARRGEVSGAQAFRTGARR